MAPSSPLATPMVCRESKTTSTDCSTQECTSQCWIAVMSLIHSQIYCPCYSMAL